MYVCVLVIFILHAIFSPVACIALKQFALPHKRHYLIVYKMCLLIFSTIFIGTFFIIVTKKCGRHYHSCTGVLISPKPDQEGNKLMFLSERRVFPAAPCFAGK